MQNSVGGVKNQNCPLMKKGTKKREKKTLKKEKNPNLMNHRKTISTYFVEQRKWGYPIQPFKITRIAQNKINGQFVRIGLRLQKQSF